MADKPALALDPLRSDVAYRIACLRHLRVNRLNASTWQQADTHWFQALDCEGVLAVQEASVLLDSYVDVRDRVLGFSPSLSSAGRTGAQATWSRNRLPSAGRSTGPDGDVLAGRGLRLVEKVPGSANREPQAVRPGTTDTGETSFLIPR